MIIDWNSPQNHVLVNPRMDAVEVAAIQEKLLAIPLTGHVWISTSGTTSTAKWAALSKKALLTSAKNVNFHLHATEIDIWFNPLPHFHVGGIGIFARSYVSNSRSVTFNGKWDPQQFCSQLEHYKVTLTSLVPTQVHDLVMGKYQAPQTLRAIIVGGGRLSDLDYQLASQLGWPLLQSYGMTECCSQIATAEIGKGTGMKVLPHVEVKITEDGLIALKSDSLLTGYAYIDESGCRWEDPKQKGWLITKDRGILNGGYLEMLGRADDLLKIGGENVDFAHLETILDQIKDRVNAVLIPFNDPRLGAAVHLCIEGNADPTNIVNEFNQKVLPYEKIRAVHYVPSFPRTELGKIKKSQLIAEIK